MATTPSIRRKVRDFAYLEKVTRNGITQKVWASTVGRTIGMPTVKKVAKGIVEAAHEKTSKIGIESSVRTAQINVRSPQQLASARIVNEQNARIVYIFDLAKEAFGDKNLATKFMKSKHPKLDATPLEKLDTEWGGRVVEQILNSMIYGLPA
jgi:uncharacterized protein (DUF2384 family)